MARPYSLDLRERVVSRVESGETVRSVAALFGISVSCVVKWSLRFRASGSAAAGKMGGHRRPILAKEHDWVLGRIEENPSITLRGLKAELAARGIAASYGTVWAFVHAEGKSFKKNRAAVRAKSRSRSKTARAMEEVPGPD
jgi:putative transposase